MDDEAAEMAAFQPLEFGRERAQGTQNTVERFFEFYAFVNNFLQAVFRSEIINRFAHGRQSIG